MHAPVVFPYSYHIIRTFPSQHFNGETSRTRAFHSTNHPPAFNIPTFQPCSHTKQHTNTYTKQSSAAWITVASEVIVRQPQSITQSVLAIYLSRFLTHILINIMSASVHRNVLYPKVSCFPSEILVIRMSCGNQQQTHGIKRAVGPDCLTQM